MSFFIVFVEDAVQCMHIIRFCECLCHFMTVYVFVCAQQLIDKCGVFICVCVSVWCVCLCVCMVFVYASEGNT